MKVETVKAKNIVSSAAAVGFKPGQINMIAAGRQMGKSFLIDQMIGQLYSTRFTLPLWAVLAARRRNDQKVWWKRFTG